MLEKKCVHMKLKQSKVSSHHIDAAPSGEWTPSGYCSQTECGRPPSEKYTNRRYPNQVCCPLLPNKRNRQKQRKEGSSEGIGTKRKKEKKRQKERKDGRKKKGSKEKKMKGNEIRKEGMRKERKKTKILFKCVRPSLC